MRQHVRSVRADLTFPFHPCPSVHPVHFVHNSCPSDLLRQGSRARFAQANNPLGQPPRGGLGKPISRRSLCSFQGLLPIRVLSVFHPWLPISLLPKKLSPRS